MTQQTTVEWLKKQYIERGETLPLGVFQEALEMEKKQIIDAHWQGFKNFTDTKEISEQYYNETYNN
jgi:hypothetical protein